MKGVHRLVHFATVLAAGALGTESVRAEFGNAGQTYPVAISSPADYAAGIAPGSEPQLVWQQTVVHTNASYIAIHFATFDLADGDRVAIHDGNGGQHYEMTGRGKMNAGTFWARHVKGDRLKLELYSSGNPGGQYLIDEYAAGYPTDGVPPPPSLCGPDDKENAACYALSHTNAYEHARAVARILVSGDEYCTGFLISTNDEFITNWHCIENPTHAIDTDFDFMAEAPACASINFKGGYAGTVLSGSTLLNVNADLDYAHVRISTGSPSSVFGHLTFDDQPPQPGTEFFLPQHPDGRAKEIAIFSTHASDTGGVPVVQSTNINACAPSVVDEVGYFADTENGSSGSPLISVDDHRVIALHHCAGCENSGIPGILVKNDIEVLNIKPYQSSAMTGVEGGPFIPACNTLTFSNNTGETTSWTTSTNMPWIEVHPVAGTLASGEVATVSVCLNAHATILTQGVHSAIVTINNTNRGTSAERRFTLQVRNPLTGDDYFTEYFTTNNNSLDLSGTMLTLTPKASPPYYQVCSSNSVAEPPEDMSGSHNLELADDDSAQVNLSNGMSVVFFGTPYTRLYVNSNGNITFDTNDTDFAESLVDHFAQVRIALSFQDLSPYQYNVPYSGGSILWKQLADRVVITYSNVSEFLENNDNTMQAILYTNGQIRLAWLNMDAPDGISGISDGSGLPVGFEESDLSGYSACNLDSDNDGIDDEWEWRNGLIVGIDDSMDDDDNDTWVNIDEFISDTIPSNPASFFMGITNVTFSGALEVRVFPTSPDRVYNLEWSTGLMHQTWTPATNAVAGTGDGLLMTMSNPPPRVILRSTVEIP